MINIVDLSPADVSRRPKRTLIAHMMMHQILRSQILRQPRHHICSSESILSTMNFERVSSYPNDDEVLSSSYKSESSFVGSPQMSRFHRRSTSSHNPTVAAMLRSNMMRDCGQVTEMYHHCVDSKADSTICKTAKQYFQSCSKK